MNEIKSIWDGWEKQAFGVRDDGHGSNCALGWIDRSLFSNSCVWEVSGVRDLGLIAIAVIFIAMLTMSVAWMTGFWCASNDVIAIKNKCADGSGWPVALRDSQGNLLISCSKVGQ